jgi:hypothetical protein
MSWMLAVLLTVTLAGDAEKAPVSDSEPIEEPEPSDEVEECQKGIKGLRKDVLGLEFLSARQERLQNLLPLHQMGATKTRRIQKRAQVLFT